MKSKEKIKSLKEKEFAKKFIENRGNLTKTVKEVYDIKDSNYAAVKGQRMIKKDNIQIAIAEETETLKAALIKSGITPEKVAEKVNVLLNAKSKIVKKDRETGEYEEVGEKPDFQAINNGLKHATNIYGIQDLNNRQNISQTYNFVFNKETQDDIHILESKIKARLLGQDDETIQ